jgi:hypothetical protein
VRGATSQRMLLADYLYLALAELRFPEEDENLELTGIDLLVNLFSREVSRLDGPGSSSSSAPLVPAASSCGPVKLWFLALGEVIFASMHAALCPALAATGCPCCLMKQPWGRMRRSGWL